MYRMDESYYNGLTAYCPVLGHHVPFSYCRRPGSSTPCSRIGTCRMDVLGRGAFPELLSRQGTDTRKSRLDMILQAVEQAKSR